MADPLSIAASVVGVVTVGVQISVKLYALGEKIATASQRVTSIANDISSTCAILNQLHDLMTPKPDANGIRRSVFNATALKDITHALRHCEAVFKEIANYQEQASKQIKGRTRPHTKVQLSRTEKAKWPFLQPQFDELRGDLRDSKGNLLLMITVASLALMQKGGQQQPVDSAEEAELKATIVDLASARSPKSKPKPSANSSNDARGFARLLRKLGPSKPTNEVHKPSDQGFGDNPRQRTIQAITMPDEPVELQASQSPELWLDSLALEPNNQLQRALTDLESLSSYKTTIPSRSTSTRSIEDPLSKLPIISPVSEHHEKDRQLTGFLTQNTNEVHITKTNTHDFQNDMATVQIIEDEVLDSRTEAQETRQQLFDARGTLQNYQTDSEYQEPDHREDVFQAWTTSVLPGLCTGFGPCMEVFQLNLPQDEIHRMIQKYTTTGYELHETFFKLNSQQRDLVSSHSTRRGGTLVYVDKSREEVLQTVLGSLNITILIWIISTPRQTKKTRKSSLDPRLNFSYAHGEATTAPPDPVRPMLARPQLRGTRMNSEESVSTNPSIVQGPLGGVHDPFTVDEPHWSYHPRVSHQSHARHISTPEQTTRDREQLESAAQRKAQAISARAEHGPRISETYEKTSQAGSRPSPVQSERSYDDESYTRNGGLAAEQKESVLTASEDPFTATRHTRYLSGTRHSAAQSHQIRSPQDIMRERREREEQRHGILPASRTFTQHVSVETLYDTAISAAPRSRLDNIPSADRWAGIRDKSEALSQTSYASNPAPLPSPRPSASYIACPPTRHAQSVKQPERYIPHRPHQPQGAQWRDEGYTSSNHNAPPLANDMMPEIAYGMDQGDDDDRFSMQDDEARPIHGLPSDPFGNQTPRRGGLGRVAPEQGRRVLEASFAGNVGADADADANAVVEELLRKWTV